MATEETFFRIQVQGATELEQSLVALTKKTFELADKKKALNAQLKTLSQAYKSNSITQKEYDEQSKILATDIVNLNSEIKSNSTSLKANEKTLTNNLKTNKAAKGSIEEMRLSLSKTQKEYYALSKAERDNDKVGGKLQRTIKAQSDELKGLEAGVGVTSRSVGDYGQAVQGVLPILGGFGRQMQTAIGIFGQMKTGLSGLSSANNNARSTVQGFGKAQEKNNDVTDAAAGSTTAQARATIGFNTVETASTGVTEVNTAAQVTNNTATETGTAATIGFATASKAAATATGIGTKALKLFRLALISTGIGAIVVAVGSLITYFTQTQRGAESLKKVFASVGAVISVIVDRISAVGEAIGDFFSGDWDAAGEKMGAAFSGVGDEMSREAELAWKLEEALIAVEKAENDLILTTAINKEKIRELRFAMDDITKSYDERAEAGKEALRLEQDLIEKQIDIQKKKLAVTLGLEEITQEKLNDIKKNGIALSSVGLSESTEEERKQAIEEAAQIFDLQSASVKLQTTLTVKLSQIEREQENKRKAALKLAEKQREKTKKAQEKAAAEKLKIQEAEAKAEEEAIAKQLDLEKKALDEQISLLSLERDLKVKSKEETNDELLKNQTLYLDELLKLNLDKAQLNGESEKQILLADQITRAELNQQFRNSEAEAIKADKEKQEEIEAEAEEKKKRNREAGIAAFDEIQKQQFARSADRLKEQTASEIATLQTRLDAGIISQEQFEIQKTAIEKKAFEKEKKLKISSIVTDGIVAIAKTFSSLGFPAAVIPAALLALQTTGQVAAVKREKFKRGGLLQGDSHANGGIPFTVNGQNGFEAEGGETLINKRSSAMFRNELSAINQAGGGVALPSVSSPSTGSLSSFANGGVLGSGGQSNIDIDGLQSQITAAVAESMQSIKVVNVAQDTTSLSGRATQIENINSF